MMTQHEAAKWLQEKDYLEPDERLTEVGLTVDNPIEEDEDGRKIDIITHA